MTKLMQVKANSRCAVTALPVDGEAQRSKKVRTCRRGHFLIQIDPPDAKHIGQ